MPLKAAALVCGLLAAFPAAAGADVALNGVNVSYHGGALLQHVKVAPLLYGSSWQGGQGAAYVKGFLTALFSDGRYMANLAQYSAGSLRIGSGSAVDPVVDAATLPKVSTRLAARGVLYQVSDTQIQSEIQAQIAAGKLPAADADTCYVVCVPADVVVTAGSESSETSFDAYHSYDTPGKFAYAVIAPTGSATAQLVDTPTGYNSTLFNRTLTAGITHELAEAVTDPQGDGWFDPNQLFGGEIGDIPATLNGLSFITDDQFYALLTGADGTKYAVQQVWSNQDRGPAAFAAAVSP
jgi:hypothetical protein